MGLAKRIEEALEELSPIVNEEKIRERWRREAARYDEVGDRDNGLLAQMAVSALSGGGPGDNPDIALCRQYLDVRAKVEEIMQFARCLGAMDKRDVGRLPKLIFLAPVLGLAFDKRSLRRKLVAVKRVYEEYGDLEESEAESEWSDLLTLEDAPAPGPGRIFALTDVRDRPAKERMSVFMAGLKSKPARRTGAE